MSGNDLSDVLDRLRRLEDVEAIRRLKADYVAASDRGYDADALAELFVEDAVWDGGPFGRHEGRETIRQWIRGLPKQILFAEHFVMAPHIVIADSGDAARAQWQLFMTAELANDDGPADAVVMMGNYDEQLVKVDGEWRLKQVVMTVNRLSNLDEGWVRQPMRP